MDLSAYYAKIMKEPLLSREDEYDLFLTYYDQGLSATKKEEIKSKLIRSNLRFVFKQAKYFSKGDPDVFEELICAGNEGLIVGFEKYKPSPEVRFLSYAGHWIFQRILKSMSGMRIVALPVWKQQLSSRIQKFVQANESPSLEQIQAAFPDVAAKDIRELSESRFLTFYLEDMDTEGPEFEIDPIGVEVEARIDKERLHKLVETLPSPHKEIIFMSYGLKDGEEKTHTEMAKELQISKDQLREYKKEAMALLKYKLEPPR